MPARKRKPVAKPRRGRAEDPGEERFDRSKWSRVPCDICGEPSNARKLCSFHYYRWKRYGDPNFVTTRVVDPGRGCLAEDCDGKHKGRGYCEKHLLRVIKFGTPEPEHLRPRERPTCPVEGCPKLTACAGYCWAHYQRIRIHGDPHVNKKMSREGQCLGCQSTEIHSRGYCNSCYSRAWRRNNPDQRAVQRFVRRNLVKAAPGAASVAQVAARLAFYGGICWICGLRPGDTIDHVKPLTRGGSNWPANLRPACKPCNTSKGNRWPFITEAAA